MGKNYYKGFDKDLKCRDFQYEIGGKYETDKAELCESGFHACEAPLNVFEYYPPANSRYCEVELDDVSDKRDNDTKVCAKKIKVGAEIGIPGLVKAHVEWVKANTTTKYTDPKMATAGNRGAATAGNAGAATAGEYGAATAGNRGAATAGKYGAATSRGSASVGENGCALVRGNGCKVRGGLGAVLVIVEEHADNCEIYYHRTVVVDGEKIKPNTWYMLKNKGLVELKEEQ